MSINIINIPTSGVFPVILVPFSTTPNFVFQPGAPRAFGMVLTANVTSSTVDTSFLPAGATVVFLIAQDGVGGRSFEWPTNFLGAQPIAQGANQTTMQVFTWTGKFFNSNGVPSVF